MSRLTKKNHDRRFGETCKNCGNKVTKNCLEGSLNGESVRFCCFACHDEYVDKIKPTTTSDKEEYIEITTSKYDNNIVCNNSRNNVLLR